MMGLYIKGMEMPKKGEYRMTLYVCDDGYAYMDVDLFPVDKDRFEAVPVPSHGKLTDADALIKQVKRDGIRSDPFVRIVCDYFKDAPTIIPADPEEEEMK